MKKISIVSTEEISKKISSAAIFKTIVREDCGLVSFRADNMLDWTSSQLAGCLGEHVNPQSKSLREYIESGLDTLDLIVDNVDALLNEINDRKDSQEVSYSSILLKKRWLKAFGLAFEKVKREEIAILFAEDWMEANQVS